MTGEELADAEVKWASESLAGEELSDADVNWTSESLDGKSSFFLALKLGSCNIEAH